MGDIKRRVSELPPQTVIVYTPLLRDGAGVSFIPVEALAAISPVANRPIVVDAETFLGHGAVGGFILSPGADGRAAARLVLRVLNGEDPGHIPVVPTVAPRPIFDWRELQRWRIPESQLPAGSEIRFRQPSVWVQYRWQISVVATVLVLQTTLIMALFYERGRRRTAEALARAAEFQELLMQELSHRIKNMMAIVQAIGAQTLRSAASVDEARESFTARLAALAVAQDELLKESKDSANISDLVAGLAAMHSGAHGRIKATGPALQLSPKATLAITLVLNELATNAAKYGALSNDKGRVEIVWDSGPAMGRDLFTLRWSEHGGPPVLPPAHKGFGSRLIERGFAGELNGSVNVAYQTAGLVCILTAPLEGLLQSPARGIFRIAEKRYSGFRKIL
jgi:two-component sensor histidine kinase